MFQNDLTYRPNGDLYFTVPVFGLPGGFEDPERELDFQGVFRVAADGRVHAVVKDLRAPNGLAFSPDGRVLYVANSQRSRPVWMAYDDRCGRSRVRRPAVRRGLGLGAALRQRAGRDEGGSPWQLFATGPGGVQVFAPDGPRLGRIIVGVPLGNVAWGPDGALFIAANQWLVRVKTLTGPPK